jgi:hypothetical protein
MKLIESKTLATAAASIEFTSIPQTFTDLVVLISGQSVTTDQNIYIKFNGNSSNYSTRNLIGLGSSVVSQSSSLGGGQVVATKTETANTFANAQVYIPNYTGNTNKSFSSDGVSEANQTGSYQMIVANLWSNTAAITSLELFIIGGGNLATGSTASLYGVLKGSDGIVTTS